MAEDNWPEFLYGGLEIAEYVQHVVSTREVKPELFALIDLVRDLTEYPFHEHGKTYQYLHRICHAMRALLTQIT